MAQPSCLFPSPALWIGRHQVTRCSQSVFSPSEPPLLGSNTAWGWSFEPSSTCQPFTDPKFLQDQEIPQLLVFPTLTFSTYPISLDFPKPPGRRGPLQRPDPSTSEAGLTPKAGLMGGLWSRQHQPRRAHLGSVPLNPPHPHLFRAALSKLGILNSTQMFLEASREDPNM